MDKLRASRTMGEFRLAFLLILAQCAIVAGVAWEVLR